MFINIKMSKLIVGVGWCVAGIIMFSIIISSMGKIDVFFDSKTVPKCKDLAEIKQYIEALGWSIEAEPYSTKEIVMPKNTDEIYEGYTAMQRKIGYRPDRYRGKKVTEYKFELKNLNSGKIPAKIRILHHKNTIVAADLYSIDAKNIFLALDTKENVDKALKLTK